MKDLIDCGKMGFEIDISVTQWVDVKALMYMCIVQVSPEFNELKFLVENI